MRKSQIDFENTPKYSIKSPDCGRDKYGYFHCVCGKCEVLQPDICHNSNHSGYNGGDCGYGGYDEIDYETP